MTAEHEIDRAPSGKFATGPAIEGWIDRQRPFIAVVDHAIEAVGLGVPKGFIGPRFIHESGPTPAHLRRGAAWFMPGPIGFTVDLFGRGAGYRIRAWGPHRNTRVDSRVVSPISLANDLWCVLNLVEIAMTSDLPFVKDGHGNAWQVHRLGCDMKVTAPGKIWCSCSFT